MGKLTSDQIKELIKREKRQSANSYRDDFDLNVDRLVTLYEQNQIDEATLKTLMSLVIVSATKETISGLHSELVRKSFLNIKSAEPNKLLLLNYSKQSYA